MMRDLRTSAWLHEQAEHSSNAACLDCSFLTDNMLFCQGRQMILKADLLQGRCRVDCVQQAPICCPSGTGGSVFDMLNRDDRASWRAKASYWLEGIRATIAITIVVFFALFMDDFRLAVLPTQLDVSCEYISGLILVCSAQTYPSTCSPEMPLMLHTPAAQQGFVAI